MSERFGSIMKIVCLGLSVLILWQLWRITIPKKLDFHIPTVEAAAPSQSKSPLQKQETNSTSQAAALQKQPDLPSAIKERVDRVTDSEILGPVVRPLPMALLGIAGADVFFRAPNGQTGLLREGEELGGIKLLRVGTNRILIEQDGKKKELMIFSGFGSETLISKEKETTREEAKNK
jgi:hypothetical protein